MLATDSLVDQGFTADYFWADAEFSLGNASDTVRMVCDGVVVDGADGLGHDGTPFRPEPEVGTVGDHGSHRAQARQGLRSNSPRP